MRSTKNMAFDLDYLFDRDDKMFNALTSDYMFKFDNYVVAYTFREYFLKHLKMCEYSEITEDCYFPYCKIIFVTCRPEDVIRMKYVAKCIPPSAGSNVRVFYTDDKTGEDVEL